MLACDLIYYCWGRHKIFLRDLAAEFGCLLELCKFEAIGWLWCIWLRFLHRYCDRRNVVLTIESPRRNLNRCSCLGLFHDSRGWSAFWSLNAVHRIWNELVSSDYSWSVAAGHVCALRCGGRFFNNYSIWGLTFGLCIILLCFLFLICQRYQLFIDIT